MTATIEQVAKGPTHEVYGDLQLKNIIRTLPPECFQKNRYKAWAALVLSVVMVGLSYGAIALSPWYLLPVAWFLAGTALTGFFVVGHDCGHRSFANRRWVNDVVGHITMMPLIYPFHCWRILHDHHHVHTNKLSVDNAWEPWTLEEYAQAKPLLRGTYEQLRGYFWWTASIAHWAGLHFDLNQFSERDRPKAKLSIAVVVVFAVIFFPTMLATVGVWGLIKFWLMPWLGYHFWMSTFTLVHHTMPDIQFRPIESWNAVESQLAGTVHCDYPRWVEVLCHDINVHVPHHISTGIPSYNLRMAHASLKHNWGHHIREERFSWQLMQQIVSRCHLYHPEQAYQAFREGKGQLQVK